jgi:translation elongation factor EF-Tu-like GTPase
VRPIHASLILAALLSTPLLSNAHDLVFLGDESRIRLLASCEPCRNQQLKVTTPKSDASAQEVANSAQRARHAVIVIDASVGPLPITREHILIARQAGVPSLSLMFTNVSKLEGMPDAGELLELEELEGRELMNKYEMGGDKALVFHESSFRFTKRLRANGVGMDEVLRSVQSLPERKVRALESFSGKKFFAYLYLLTPQESKHTAPLTNDSSVGLWIAGQSVRVRVGAKQAMQPGGNGELEFEAEKTIVAPIGSRLLLARSGRVVAAGVLSRGG